jgi:hypothetical protein
MNPSLGDVRAENDKRMLERAFFASPDYRTLIESDQKSIVVGRRGTGKSALFLKLSENLSKQPKHQVIKIAPDEHEVLALREASKRVTDDFRISRALIKLAFKFAVLIKLGSELQKRFKFKNAEDSTYLADILKLFDSPTYSALDICRALFRSIHRDGKSAEPVEAMLEVVNLSRLEKAVSSALSATNSTAAILVDRVDEGYEPDDLGTAVVDGIAHAVIEIQDKIEGCRSILFLRDNIYRALAKSDPDFSRNIEQSVLRLHWDEEALFAFICDRLRIAFNLSAEKSLRVWDAVTVNGLKGKDGFRLCLRLTLYRPRDLLLLMNEAFRRAGRIASQQISEKEIGGSAKSISESRLADLDKEYGKHFPGLDLLISRFNGTKPEWTISGIDQLLTPLLSDETLPGPVIQHFRILSDARSIIRDLFSIGFLGLSDSATGNFVFCHDGRSPEKQLGDELSVLVHPCYWMALNFSADGLSEDQAAAIYDEYDVVVVSETPELRVQKIGQMERALDEIEEGRDDCEAFEAWCFEACRMAFAGSLTNFELRPNKSSLQRRDIVATNLGESLFWRRIKEDYGSRQIIFEVKNYRDLSADDFRQVLSYTGNEYGKFAILISRVEDINLRKDKELKWIRELRNQHSCVILLINGKFLCKLLHKLRSVQRFDAAEKQMSSLLDQYIRVYFNEIA